jgi:hypothetical protein
MAAKRGQRRSSWILCGGVHGDGGNSIGLRRKSRGSTHCLRGPSGRVQPDKHDPNYGSYVIIILSHLKYSSRSRDARDPEAGDTLR